MAAPSSPLFAPAGLEPGDRFEVTPIGGTGRLSLPRVLGPDGFPIEQIEDPAGRPLDLALDRRGELARRAEAGRGRLPIAGRPLWLEYRAPGRFRLIVEPGTPHPANGEIVTEQGVPIEFDPGDWPVVQDASASRPAGARAVRPGDPGRPAGHACRVRPADRAALGPRHRAARAPDPHGQDRAAAVPRPGHALRRSRPGQDHRGRARPLRADDPRAGPLGAGPRAAVADRAVAGRDAPQVLDRADQPRRPRLPRPRAPPPGTSSTA